MSNAWIVARKELRALFQSSVALVFLGVFLATTLFVFFGASRFFARDLADVRPLFAWLPLLLVFLVSAVTMRMWPEERRAGTLEVLLTLPVRTGDLVLGKFLAGLGLVAIALALTLPLPLLVSTLGPLDWGPVIGGYVGALALSSAYLAIGLCIGSRTDNQVVALLTTSIVGGVAYLVGTDAVTSLFSTDTAELLRGLGTGSRFESVERGVLDLRDLVYYASLTVTGLVLNYASLAYGRLDPDSTRGRARARSLVALVGLTAANALAANVWLAPVTWLRWDLTERGEYSISEVTERALRRLDEPLVIEAFFSERTHPLLAPLVPPIRDMLAEYQVAAGDGLTVTFADPASDEELEARINEQYGIRSFPFGVEDRNAQSVVNSYFHVLVRYGDEYEVLDFQDLIEARPEADGIEVRLRNLEYDLTRAITRVSTEFQTLESVMAKLPGQARLTAYVTPAQLPEDFRGAADAMRKVGAGLAARSGGRLVFTEVDPSGDRALQERLFADWGVQPLAVDLFGDQVFYLHLVLEAGDEVQRVTPRADLTEGDLERALEAAIRRATPGWLETVALFTEQPAPPPPDPRLPPQMQPSPPQPEYRALQQLLAQSYEVLPTQLEDGYVPDEVDVLVVGKVGALTDAQRFAIDQYLMRGGSVIALAGAYRVGIERGGLRATPEHESLFALLEQYGVVVEDRLVMDPRNVPFPIPVQEQRGDVVLQRVELLPYPMFPDLRPGAGDADHAALAGLPAVTTPWASPVTLASEAPEGRTFEVLLQTSPETWLQEGPSIDPDFEKWPVVGFGPSGTQQAQVVAATVTGTFDSAFANAPNPLFSDAEHDGAGRTLARSVTEGRLVVVGSSEIVSDLTTSLAGQAQGEAHRNNFQLLQNLIDWSVEDTELLQIRSSGAFARTLASRTDAERRNLELTAYALVALPLGLLVVAPRLRRRRVRAIAVPPAPEQAG